MNDFKDLLKRDLLLYIATGIASFGMVTLQSAIDPFQLKQVVVGVCIELVSVAIFFLRAYLKKIDYLD